MVKITDERSAEAWFKTQPQEICVAMAARAALRALPGMVLDKPEWPEPNLLIVLRDILTSTVAASDYNRNLVRSLRPTFRPNDTYPDPGATASVNARTAAHLAIAAIKANPSGYAARAVFCSFLTSRNAEHYAPNRKIISNLNQEVTILSANSAFDASSRDASEVEALTQTPTQLLARPIWWQSSEPTGISQGKTLLLDYFYSEEETWAFWKRWYLDMFNGTWRDWDLARDVALIPDDVWKQGAAAVAEAIKGIEARRAPLDGTAARAQVASLRQDPKAASLCAEGLARYLKQVIEAAKCDFNGLPEPFQPLAPLTAKLFQLSTSVLSAPDPAADAELADLLQSSAVHVASLVERLRDAQTEVARLRHALSEAKDIADQNRLREAAFQSPKTGWLRDFSIATAGSAAGAIAPIFLPELYGYLTSGLGVLLGPEMNQVLSDLGGCYADFIRPEMVPDLGPPTPEELNTFETGNWA